MRKFFKLVKIISSISVVVAIWAFIVERKDEKRCKSVEDKHRPYGVYERYIKRPLDVFLSTGAFIVFSPILLITAILVKLKLGSPVIFSQERPGKIDPLTGESKIFKLYKFRSMTDARDEKGNLLPDDIRLTPFGKKLRSTSLDELPELINIIKGDMSVIGPRPLSTVYLPYYNNFEKHRHDIRPGLTGAAQVNGRNSMTWEEKFNYDVRYTKKISFFRDVAIIIKTLIVVIKHNDIGQGDEMPESFHIKRQRDWDRDREN